MLTQVIVWDSLKLLVGLLGLLYAALVLTSYVTEGPHYQPRLRLAEPLRSGERLLVWTGIKVMEGLLKLFRSIFDQLFAASAEVGFWVVDKSGPKAQRKVRSKFL